MLCGVSQGNTYPFTDQSGMSIEITSLGSDLACLYVDEMEINHPNATAGIQSGRYWLIRGLQSDKQSNATGFSLNLTLPTSFTLDGNDKVCRYPGGLGGAGWDCAMDSFTSNSITRLGVTALSDWAVGDNVGPSAVQLSRFHGETSSAEYPLAGLILSGGVGLFWLLFYRLRKPSLPTRLSHKS